MRSTSEVARLSALVVAGAALVIALAACRGGGSDASSSGVAATATTDAALRDPASPGPYGVGLIELTFTRASNATGEPRPLRTLIWYPTDGRPSKGAQRDAAPASQGGPFPVVVFSHGSGGEPEFYSFFTEHLASWGFIVAAPAHIGNTSADCVLCDMKNILASARERPDDVTFVLDQVLAMRGDASQPLHGVIDPDRAALVGHSFGGWTAVFDAPRGRFQAIVSMAPGLPETLLGAAPKVQTPLMLMAGEKDEVVPKGSVDKLWGALPPETERSYVLMPEGRHLTFVDRCLGCTDGLPEGRGHELVNRYATAFLEVYLVGDQRFRSYVDAADPPDAVVVGK
jgi:predicted dienelactone hydrolase